MNSRTVHDLGVDHIRPQVIAAKKLLNASKIITQFRQMRCKGVAERVATDRLGDPCRTCSLLDRTLESVFMDEVAMQG
jgi:hypothetical protein